MSDYKVKCNVNNVKHDVVFEHNPKGDPGDERKLEVKLKQKVASEDDNLKPSDVELDGTCTVYKRDGNDYFERDVINYSAEPETVAADDTQQDSKPIDKGDKTMADLTCKLGDNTFTAQYTEKNNDPKNLSDEEAKEAYSYTDADDNSLEGVDQADMLDGATCEVADGVTLTGAELKTTAGITTEATPDAGADPKAAEDAELKATGDKVSFYLGAKTNFYLADGMGADNGLGFGSELLDFKFRWALPSQTPMFLDVDLLIGGGAPFNLSDNPSVSNETVSNTHPEDQRLTNFSKIASADRAVNIDGGVVFGGQVGYGFGLTEDLILSLNVSGGLIHYVGGLTDTVQNESDSAFTARPTDTNEDGDEVICPPGISPERCEQDPETGEVTGDGVLVGDDGTDTSAKPFDVSKDLSETVGFVTVGAGLDWLVAEIDEGVNFHMIPEGGYAYVGGRDGSDGNHGGYVGLTLMISLGSDSTNTRYEPIIEEAPAPIVEAPADAITLEEIEAAKDGEIAAPDGGWPDPMTVKINGEEAKDMEMPTGDDPMVVPSSLLTAESNTVEAFDKDGTSVGSWVIPVKQEEAVTVPEEGVDTGDYRWFPSDTTMVTPDEVAEGEGRTTQVITLTSFTSDVEIPAGSKIVITDADKRTNVATIILKETIAQGTPFDVGLTAEQFQNLRLKEGDSANVMIQLGGAKVEVPVTYGSGVATLTGAKASDDTFSGDKSIRITVTADTADAVPAQIKIGDHTWNVTFPATAEGTETYVDIDMGGNTKAKYWHEINGGKNESKKLKVKIQVTPTGGETTETEEVLFKLKKKGGGPQKKKEKKIIL